VIVPVDHNCCLVFIQISPERFHLRIVAVLRPGTEKRFVPIR
jgi:hypothetical protein